MKSALLFFLAIGLLFSQFSCKRSNPVELPRFSLLSQSSLDARANCVLLDSSNAARANIIAGTYPLRTWGTSGKSVCVAFADGNTPGLQVRTMFAGYDYPITIGQDSIFFAFFTASSSFEDTSTLMTFDFGVSRITVTALHNSISIASIPATVVDIPSAGNYSISFSNSATVFERNIQTGFFLQQGNSPSDVNTAWTMFPTYPAPTRVYLFFVDAGTRSDNSGVVTVNLHVQTN